MSIALVACSSSGSSAHSGPGGTSSAPPGSVQAYLDAVNSLCDALLYQVVNGPHGGDINMPATDYLAYWPGHKQLLDGFDAAVVKVKVPAAAKDKAAAYAAYVRYADQLEQTRLAAAQKGQAAFSKQVQSESGVHDIPQISAMVGAGFKSSCTAR